MFGFNLQLWPKKKSSSTNSNLYLPFNLSKRGFKSFLVCLLAMVVQSLCFIAVCLPKSIAHAESASASQEKSAASQEKSADTSSAKKTTKEKTETKEKKEGEVEKEIPAKKIMPLHLRDLEAKSCASGKSALVFPEAKTNNHRLSVLLYVASWNRKSILWANEVLARKVELQKRGIQLALFLAFDTCEAYAKSNTLKPAALAAQVGKISLGSVNSFVPTDKFVESFANPSLPAYWILDASHNILDFKQVNTNNSFQTDGQELLNKLKKWTDF